MRLAAFVAAAVLIACGEPSTPKFELLSTNWLLCPASATDLKMCCPQPADPRRCVIPNGAAPTDLIAVARLRNTGTPGGAMATLSAPSATCSATVPHTPTGSTAQAWCSLGVITEPAAPPQISIRYESDG
jgi:hypothetical protein